MPKERRVQSLSFGRRSRAFPFSASSSSRKSLDRVESAKDIKEWEEALCPVCLEHPHNAVLLLCSSHDNGCRPFMCDTSYRHSNCLDQYCKALSGSKPPQDVDGMQQPTNLLCPLCRGLVSGWTVIEPARRHMNAKSRSCSTESCVFSGTYGDLRKHARKEHPSTRPSEADPERQQDWRRMEQQRDLGDLFSMFHSAVTEGQAEVSIDEDDEEDSNSMLLFPSVAAMVLVVHVRQAGGDDTDRSSQPRFYITRPSSGDSSGSRRGSGMISLAEAIGNSRSTSRETHDGGANDDSRSSEADTASQQNQG
ncbi:unnamed protein product [Musa acuminata var. zebrina]